MTEISKSIFSMTRTVSEEEKIALKGPDWALSNDAVFWLRTKLLEGAIPLLSLMALYGHWSVIGRILDANILGKSFVLFYGLPSFILFSLHIGGHQGWYPIPSVQQGGLP